MKRAKGAICLVIAMIMLLTAPSMAYAYSSDDSSTNHLSVMTVDASTSVIKLASADVVSIAYKDIDLIAKDAKSLVDKGKMIYISAPKASAEVVANMLSIPKDGTLSYNNNLLVGYSIFSVDGLYVFQCHYATFSKDSDETEPSRGVNHADGNMAEIPLPKNDTPNFDVVKTVDTSDAAATGIIADGLGVAIDERQKTVEELSSIAKSSNDASQFRLFSSTWPNSPNRIYTNTLSVYNGNTYYGYVAGTVKVYDVGQVLVNGTSQFVYNVVSQAEAYPISTAYVNQYKCRIHCNIAGHTFIEAVSLPSGISYTQGVGLQGGYSKAGGSGTITYNTSWTYNPESQVVTRSSPQTRVVDWTAKTVSPTKGKSYDLTPGMTMASNGSVGQRGAFSDIYCDAMFLGITLQSNSMEVGGWF